VTHDQVEAMTLGNRIGVMNNGRLVQVGRPGDVYAKPADRFVAGFIGSPSMAFVEARVENAASGPEAAVDGLRLRVPPAVVSSEGSLQDRVSLGIRPEAVTLSAPTNGDSAWEIDLVEDLGFERIVVVRRGDHVLRTRLSFRELRGVSAGDRVDLAVDPELVHYFDGEGRRI
jgi:ABC-type sugar transport system ATPase subunit